MSSWMENKLVLAVVVILAILLLGKTATMSGFMALETPGASGGFIENDPASVAITEKPQDAPIRPVGFGSSSLPAVNPLTNNRTTSVRARNDNENTRIGKNINQSFDPRGVPNAAIDFWTNFDPNGPGMGQLENSRIVESAPARKLNISMRDPHSASRSTIIL